MGHTTKEAWLTEAMTKLRPIFAGVGKPIPDGVRIEVVRSLKGNRIGECSSLGHIRIHDTLIARTALPVLVHELLHAAVGIEHGHGGDFIVYGKKIGLWPEGCNKYATYGVTSWRLQQLLRTLESLLGEYPKNLLTV